MMQQTKGAGERVTFAAPRPHHVWPAVDTVRCVLAVKSFAQASHIGLGVTALCTMKMLRRAGVHVEVWTCADAADLRARVDADYGVRPLTHVIVSSPAWVQPDDFVALSSAHPEIDFVQLNHSGMAYLSIDKHGIQNIRAVADMELSRHNVHVAWNNPRGSRWADTALGAGALLLPNLYDVESFVTTAPPRVNQDPLRIGSFGASRPWKNQLTAAEAAIALARRLGVTLEFYVNSGRPEHLHGGRRLVESRAELFADLPGTKLIDVVWAPWPQFRKVVRTMDLLLMPSFDETFCVVVADAIAEGVPAVVTGAMEWAPDRWCCDPWDPSDVADVGMGLLHDPNPVTHARELLTDHVDRGTDLWMQYFVRGQG